MGKCLIINLQEEDRSGSKEDVKNLETLFTELDFDIVGRGIEKEVRLFGVILFSAHDRRAPMIFDRNKSSDIAL